MVDRQPSIARPGYDLVNVRAEGQRPAALQKGFCELPFLSCGNGIGSLKEVSPLNISWASRNSSGECQTSLIGMEVRGRKHYLLPQ